MHAQFKFTRSLSTPTLDKEKVAAITDSVEAANERVLAYVVDANRRLADFAVTSADRAAEALPVAVPFADKLPTPTESAERYLDFVERAVAVNREFNQRVLARLTVDAPAVVETVTERVTETVTETVAEPVTAKKAPAKKASVKKATATKAATKKATTKAPARKAAAKKATTKSPAKQAAATTSTSSS
jgi:hypothetical protein